MDKTALMERLGSNETSSAHDELANLCEILALCLTPNESVVHADFNETTPSRLKLITQAGIVLLLLVPFIVLPIPVILQIVILIGGIITVSIISTSAAEQNLWALTDKRIIRVTKNQTQTWNLTDVQQFFGQANGDFVSFYTGSTSASRVTMYFLRNPEKMAECLTEQLNLPINMGGRTKLITKPTPEPRWVKEACLAAIAVGIVSALYFTAYEVPKLAPSSMRNSSSVIDKSVRREVFTFALKWGIAGGVAYLPIYALFRRNKTVIADAPPKSQLV